MFNWNQEMRRRVYRRLFDELGPHASWGQGPQGGDTLSPPDRRGEFETALRELAIELGGEEQQWTAIEQQVRWGLTRQRQIVHQNHFRTMVMNKTAAIEEGLLSYRDMPTAADLRFDPTTPDGGEID